MAETDRFNDPEKRLAIERYEYVDILFPQADTDVLIRLREIRPIDPQLLRYEVVRQSAGAVIYQDASAGRKEWQPTHIYLRASAPTSCRLLLYIETDAEEIDPLDAPAGLLAGSAENSFGVIHVDANDDVVADGPGATVTFAALNNIVITTDDESDIVYWKAIPSGSNTEVQFNDNGLFGAEPEFTYEKVTATLTVDGTTGSTAISGQPAAATLGVQGVETLVRVIDETAGQTYLTLWQGSTWPDSIGLGIITNTAGNTCANIIDDDMEDGTALSSRYTLFTSFPTGSIAQEVDLSGNTVIGVSNPAAPHSSRFEFDRLTYDTLTGCCQWDVWVPDMNETWGMGDSDNLFRLWWNPATTGKVGLRAVSTSSTTFDLYLTHGNTAYYVVQSGLSSQTWYTFKLEWRENSDSAGFVRLYTATQGSTLTLIEEVDPGGYTHVSEPNWERIQFVVPKSTVASGYLDNIKIGTGGDTPDSTPSAGNPAHALIDMAGHLTIDLVTDTYGNTSKFILNAAEIELNGVTTATLTATTINLDATTVLSNGDYLILSGHTLTGDVTGTLDTDGSTALTIPDETITYAKMQHVSAASRLLGRGSAAGAWDVEEIILGSGLTMTGTTLSASGSDSYGPVGDGGEPMSILSNGAGQPLMVPYNA